MHDQEVGAEVGVDPDAVGHLGGPVADEEEDARQETAGREATAHEGHRPKCLPLAEVKVGRDVEDESKVGQMIARADCVANAVVEGSTVNKTILES